MSSRSAWAPGVYTATGAHLAHLAGLSGQQAPGTPDVHYHVCLLTLILGTELRWS